MRNSHGSVYYREFPFGGYCEEELTASHFFPSKLCVCVYVCVYAYALFIHVSVHGKRVLYLFTNQNLDNSLPRGLELLRGLCRT